MPWSYGEFGDIEACGDISDDDGFLVAATDFTTILMSMKYIVPFLPVKRRC